MERKVINRKNFSFWSLKNRTFSVLSPLACFQCVDTLMVGIKTFERHVIKGGRAQEEIYHGLIYIPAPS